MRTTAPWCSALVATVLILAGCAAPRSHDGWFEAASALHDAQLDFPAAPAILEGFDELRPNDELERGDRALYGVRLANETFLVLLEVAGPVVESVGSVMQSLALEPPTGDLQPAAGSWVYVDEPRDCRLVATVFDSAGTLINRDRLLMASTLFCTGLAAGCASQHDYAEELRRQRLGPAARRVLMAWAACDEFLRVVRHSDSLRPLLEQAITVSLWSVLRRFSIKVSVVRRIHAAVPHGGGYRFPLTIRINEEPALDCSMVVTEPRSPLNVGAGVLSVVGIRPGEREPAVTLRLLAARRGTPR